MVIYKNLPPINWSWNSSPTVCKISSNAILLCRLSQTLITSVIFIRISMERHTLVPSLFSNSSLCLILNQWVQWEYEKKWIYHLFDQKVVVIELACHISCNNKARVQEEGDAASFPPASTEYSFFQAYQQPLVVQHSEPLGIFEYKKGSIKFYQRFHRSDKAYTEVTPLSGTNTSTHLYISSSYRSV